MLLYPRMSELQLIKEMWAAHCAAEEPKKKKSENDALKQNRGTECCTGKVTNQLW